MCDWGVVKRRNNTQKNDVKRDKGEKDEERRSWEVGKRGRNAVKWVQIEWARESGRGCQKSGIRYKTCRMK
jgi:hypothetical protein